MIRKDNHKGRKMDTPIYQFVEQWNQKHYTRFHMPGHKGNREVYNNSISAVFPYDITEIEGADVLFASDGIIRKSERRAAELFGSKDTVYSAGGSTLCIQTMVGLAAKRGKKIIAGRNAHMAFIHACILFQMDPIWILPQTVDAYGVCGLITSEQVENTLREHSDSCAVYLTSPDYLGNTIDLKRISEICKAYGVPLFCDNAHGAYLKFTGEGSHPLDQGVDICCDSAHKTLPVLTGGAYLHWSKSFEISVEEVKKMMSLFGSSSPSYLILQSLDLCNRYLSESAFMDYQILKRRICQIKEQLSQQKIGFLKNQVDFAKLTIDANSIGYTGEELKEQLHQAGIEAEYYNQQYVVYLLSPMNCKEDDDIFCKALQTLSIRPQKNFYVDHYQLPPKDRLPFEAYWQDAKVIPIEQAEKRIAAETVASCPPGVPLIVPGEIITEQIKKICKNSRNLFIKVVK